MVDISYFFFPPITQHGESDHYQFLDATGLCHLITRKRSVRRFIQGIPNLVASFLGRMSTNESIDKLTKQLASLYGDFKDRLMSKADTLLCHTIEKTPKATIWNDEIAEFRDENSDDKVMDAITAHFAFRRAGVSEDAGLVGRSREDCEPTVSVPRTGTAEPRDGGKETSLGYILQYRHPYDEWEEGGLHKEIYTV
ncbi:hypothetical protein MMC10_007173 [Thelotrema lepadinum]|nr:hypothetical protein [Thelotrema lepadinum]